MQPRVHAHHTHLCADPRRGSAGPAASAYKVTWQKYVVGLGEEGEVFEILAGGSPAIISPVVTSSKYTIRVFSRNLNHDPGLFPPSPSLPKAGCTCLPDPPRSLGVCPDGLHACCTAVPFCSIAHGGVMTLTGGVMAAALGALAANRRRVGQQQEQGADQDGARGVRAACLRHWSQVPCHLQLSVQISLLRT